MFFINILAIAVILFLVYYLLYGVYVIYCSTKYRLWKLKYKYSSVDYFHNLNIAVYSHNDGNDVAELLEQIKKQDYPADKYKINIILDNCTDNSAKLLEILGGARIWRINSENGKKLGRNASLEWYIDRVLASENTNAFVFLTAKNDIEKDFLGHVNDVLGDYPVVIGRRVPNEEGNKFVISMRNFLDKLHCEIMMKGRSIAELQLTIDTSLMAVRQEVLEKIRFINVENQSFENLYSMLLAKSDIATAFYDEMKAYSKKQTTMHGLFKKYFNFVKLNFKSFVHGMLYIFKASNSVKFKEYVFSLVYPSDVVLILLLAFIVSFAGKDGYVLRYTAPYYVLSCYITTMFYLFLAAKVNYKEVLLYPAKLIGTILLPVGAKFKFELPKDVKAFEQIKEFKDINLERIKEIFAQLSQIYQKSRLASVEPEDAYDVYLTDGKLCKLQILEQDGLVRAVLWFNKKRLSSSEHIRTSAAIAELSEKLLSKGFALKICQNCGYFEEKKDGRHNSVEGKCYFGMVKNDLKEADVVQLWGQCNNIIPAHVREYIKKQLENKE